MLLNVDVMLDSMELLMTTIVKLVCLNVNLVKMEQVVVNVPIQPLNHPYVILLELHSLLLILMPKLLLNVTTNVKLVSEPPTTVPNVQLPSIDLKIFLNVYVIKDIMTIISN